MTEPVSDRGYEDRTLGEVGEFPFLEGAIAGLREGKGMIVGPGDDAAVMDLLAATAGDLILQTTDMFIEDTHFSLATHSPEDIGYKSIAVNLSDIAAMGGAPMYVLMSVAAPPSTRAGWMARVIGAAAHAAEAAGAAIIGGDVTRSEKVAISVTVTGRTPSRRLCRRDGARAGDLVLVTGTLGDSAVGLRLLRDESAPSESADSSSSPRKRREATPDPDDRKYLIARHLRPTARIAEGRILASRGATALIDVSDGLLRDLAHICEQSGVAAEISEDSIPISEECSRFAALAGAFSPLELALSGGEDYELIAAVPPGQEEVIVPELVAGDTRATVIGKFVEDSQPSAGRGSKGSSKRLTGGRIDIVRKDGSVVPANSLLSTGWDSFVSGV